MKVIQFMFLFFVSSLMSTASSAEAKFSIPGQKLWGKWRIMEYSVPEKYLAPGDVDALRNNRLYLPIGQIVEMDDAGIYHSRRSLQAGRPKNFPHIQISLRGPFSDELCKRQVWKPYCDNGKLVKDFEFDEILPVVVAFRDYMFPKCRPEASSAEYHLFDVNTGYFAIFARTIGSKRLCVGLRGAIEYRDDNGIPRKLQAFYGIWERMD